MSKKRLSATDSFTPHTYAYLGENDDYIPEYIHFYTKRGKLRATFAVMEVNDSSLAGIVVGVARAHQHQTGPNDPPISRKEGMRLAEERLVKFLECETKCVGQGNWRGLTHYMGPKGRSFFFSYEYIEDVLGVKVSRPIRKHKGMQDYAYLLTKFVEDTLYEGRESTVDAGDEDEYFYEFLDLKTWRVKPPRPFYPCPEVVNPDGPTVVLSDALQRMMDADWDKATADKGTPFDEDLAREADAYAAEDHRKFSDDPDDAAEQDAFDHEDAPPTVDAEGNILPENAPED